MSQHRIPITSHVLNTATGQPATGITVTLQMLVGDKYETIGSGLTNLDGRVPDLLNSDHVLQSGQYRCCFDTAQYYSLRGEKSFYPSVKVEFIVEDVQQHYHIPLLLSPFGYSTYRGS